MDFELDGWNERGYAIFKSTKKFRGEYVYLIHDLGLNRTLAKFRPKRGTLNVKFYFNLKPFKLKVLTYSKTNHMMQVKIN